VLGVPRSADAKAVKSAYRKMALVYHPDKLKMDASAEEKEAQETEFQKIAQAYVASVPTAPRLLRGRCGRAPRDRAGGHRDLLCYVLGRVGAPPTRVACRRLSSRRLTRAHLLACRYEILSDSDTRARYDRGEDVTNTNPQQQQQQHGFPHHFFQQQREQQQRQQQQRRPF
jgi:hypothetical protein